MPNAQKELFEEMVLAGVVSIKRIMEREDLDETITIQDTAKIATAIEGGLNNWVAFMQAVKKEARN